MRAPICFRAPGEGRGINVVHINTEPRVAWRRWLEEGLAKEPDEVMPHKILPETVEAVKLRLFNGIR